MLFGTGLTFVVLLLTTFCCDALSRQKRIVGGYPSLIPEADGFIISQPSPPKPDNNVVLVEDDYRTARVTGVQEPEGYFAYKGIRYAEPPVGRLRFQVRWRRANLSASRAYKRENL